MPKIIACLVAACSFLPCINFNYNLNKYKTQLKHLPDAMGRYKFSCRNGEETSVCKRNILYVWFLHSKRNGWTQDQLSWVKRMDPGSTLLGERCCHQRLVENQATETLSHFQKIEDYQRKHQVAIFYSHYSLEQAFIILHWKVWFAVVRSTDTKFR